MAKQRSSRGKQSVDLGDDAFIARVLALTVWAKRNARTLIMAGIVAAIAIAAGVYYMNFRSALHQQATTRLAEIRQAVASGNRPLAVRDLESFLERFDDTPAAPEARVVLARLYLEEGTPTDAIPVITPVAGDLDEPLGAAAASLLADAYLAADSLERAESVLLRIADDARFGFQRREALADAAMLRMERGDAAGAAELYARAVTMTPEDDPQRGIYEMRLAEARAAATPATTDAADTG